MIAHSTVTRGRRADRLLGIVFAVLTCGLLAALAASPEFVGWAFERHHNVWSWYVRPLFLIPFCAFAYRRSWAGMSLTLLLLATSMFWFSAPTEPDPAVARFLQAEVDYLTGPWTTWKALGTILVPLTLGALATALWRRNLRFGLVVLVLIAVLKMTWSVIEAGSAGLAVVAPAVVGLVLCAAALGL